MTQTHGGTRAGQSLLGKAPLRTSMVRQVLHVLYLGLWGQQEKEVPGLLSQQGHISMLVIPIPAG